MKVQMRDNLSGSCGFRNHAAQGRTTKRNSRNADEAMCHTIARWDVPSAYLPAVRLLAVLRGVSICEPQCVYAEDNDVYCPPRAMQVSKHVAFGHFRGAMITSDRDVELLLLVEPQISNCFERNMNKTINVHGTLRAARRAGKFDRSNTNAPAHRFRQPATHPIFPGPFPLTIHILQCSVMFTTGGLGSCCMNSPSMIPYT
jgi:hypothetical protein